MQRYIGVVGGKGTGKDTFAGYLSEAYRRRGVPVHRDAIAAPMKRMAVSMGFPPDVVFGPSELRESWEHPVLKMTARVFLQTIGEAIRGVNGYAWISQAIATAGVMFPGDAVVIFTDVRHPEEVQAIKAAMGVIVHVSRLAADTLDSHPSEVWARCIDVRSFDYLVPNDGTPACLRGQAEVIAGAIMLGWISGLRFTGSRSHTSG